MKSTVMKDMALEPGLYLTATPIGCLEDISLRALRVLRCCQAIYCEDTRVSRKLLNAYEITTPLLTYHDHNADEVRPHILERLQRGEALALISDAGLPLVADPGFKLVRECFVRGYHVTVVPGASAFLTASLLSGFPTAPLTFLGFASRLSAEALKGWTAVPSTLAFFEAPHKMLMTLEMLKDVFPRRRVAVLRELTKVFEERVEGEFDEVLEHFREVVPRGEMVIVLSPPCETAVDEEEIDQQLQSCAKDISCRDAADIVAKRLHISRKAVYARALMMKKEGVDST